MVFDPAHAPRLRGAFLDWFQNGTQIDGHDYSSPARLGPPLAQAYQQLATQFPPRASLPVAAPAPVTVSGGLWRRLFPARAGLAPAAAAPVGADYSFAENFIYLSFLGEVADHAYQGVLRVAFETGAGFYNAASEWGEILHDREQIAPYLGL